MWAREYLSKREKSQTESSVMDMWRCCLQPQQSTRAHEHIFFAVGLHDETAEACAKTWETQTKIERRKYCTFDVLSARTTDWGSITSCYCFVIHGFGDLAWHSAAVETDITARSLITKIMRRQLLWLSNKGTKKSSGGTLTYFSLPFLNFSLEYSLAYGTTRLTIINSTTQHCLERRKWFSRPNPKDWRFNFHSKPKFLREEVKTARTWYGDHYSRKLRKHDWARVLCLLHQKCEEKLRVDASGKAAGSSSCSFSQNTIRKHLNFLEPLKINSRILFEVFVVLDDMFLSIIVT